MNTNHKPATPLPWEWLPHEGQFIVTPELRKIIAEVPCQGAEPQDGAYIVHTVNAYPKLVERLRDTIEELTHQDLDGLGNQRRADAIALLRELGESN